MTTRNAESSQGDGGIPPPPPGPPDHLSSHGGNTVFKSGPLLLSSKGIGWTSWKKRWFILTCNSLVFFRSDPNAVPQKGSEVNLTLGGIDLNNSGSVEAKADKKLLTVLFPDGRDGRTFTLKAETLDDLYEWKAALENALAQAPSAAHVMGQNVKDRQSVKSSVVGRPILLALEDVDGAPSFLEKSLRFIEEYGVKVEGILRQAAYVDDVERRVWEYEQGVQICFGKMEFSPEEDPHVVADCVKYVLRELPSSPIPASCCNALLKACRTDRGVRVNAIRAAIFETFPEPNRHLLQRVLVMMQTVASHKAENRMSSSAVAACMAPLLLRPLLAGDCEIEHDFNVGGDGSAQLLQAAAAANHAQAIVITLLEEYYNIFREGSMSPEMYSDSEESGSESEEATDADESYEGDATQESDADDDLENASSESCGESGNSRNIDFCDAKDSDSDLGSKSPGVGDASGTSQKLSSNLFEASLHQHAVLQISGNHPNQSNSSSAKQATESAEILRDVSKETFLNPTCARPTPTSCIITSTTISNGPAHCRRSRTLWGRNAARKNLSMESIDYTVEDEVKIQRLEATKIELLNRIAEETKGNAVLQASLERRKKALHERRLALEQDVARLQEQLQKERDLRTTLEAGSVHLPVLATTDEKTKAELEEIARVEADVINLKQHVDKLESQLNHECKQNYCSMHASYNQPQQTPNRQEKMKDKQKDTEAVAASLVERSRSKEANSTTSALSKLTSRLNFMKERRSQVTNELQKMEKGRRSGQVAQNLDKGQGFEVQSVPDLDVGEEAFAYCTLPVKSHKGGN
ncbi:rho GTPase-activating protein REN1-like isoform X1 [Juglans regia]|uniref:Rho GTPase-activating protein REN1-like isoform X1 n=1 Tax=Juglans regia TaxID=51240 RepID=A0A6P9EWK3_JUGRE|nr:rho GTPase-activating protein REN1-like isoform X1 [Juglans regia]XP_035551637.1 rho GTPase-activating protein REN1-like isoform X1 [Juglans regia]XP_035551638.1 rho GTPase-activating protein REN1-like isoform X1 [Juglans regia]